MLIGVAGCCQRPCMGSYIPHVVDCDGPKISLSKQIAQAFGNYYSLFYNLSGHPSVTITLWWLSLLSSPPLTFLSVAMWPGGTITIEELQVAVRPTKPGKSPGLGGFTMQYYKVLLPLLGPYMVKMFNALTSKSLLSSWPLTFNFTFLNWFIWTK